MVGIFYSVKVNNYQRRWDRRKPDIGFTFLFFCFEKNLPVFNPVNFFFKWAEKMGIFKIYKLWFRTWLFLMFVE